MDANHKSPYLAWVAGLLIVGVCVLRLCYLAWWCPLDLSPDEAYYWDWSRQLDWAYHSKGPLVAWLIRLSCTCFGDTMVAVRLPAVVCGGLTLWGVFTLTRRVYQCERLALAVVLAAMTLPILAAGSILMTIDAPFTCAWMWALVFAHRAVFTSSRWAWAGAGLCVMVGFLAKPTMVLWLPSFALFLVFTPAMRQQLRRPAFWMLIGIALLGTLPALLWNAANGWVTLRHTQMHVGLEKTSFVDWIGPLRFVATQIGVLCGFWFLVWACAAWAHRPTRDENPQTRFLWWMSVPTFLFFGLFSFKNGGGEPNWPVAGYLSGIILAAGWLSNALKGSTAIWRRHALKAGVAGSLAVGLMITCLLHAPTTMQPVFLRIAGTATDERPTPMRRIDPTCRLRGWRYLAREVDQVRAAVHDPVLAAERWTQAGELAFYCEGQPTVACFGLALGDRDTQYDLWRPNPVADPDAYRRRTFILVGLDLERLRDAFDEMEEPRLVTYCEDGEPIAQWTVTVARGYRGVGRKQP